MKKTINISLGGIVFNIEEDAHQKLSAYLDAISSSLKSSEGHDEIMSDIEARIAELLQPKVSSFKQVINIAEIEEVIGIMGSPEEFAPGHSETKKEDSYTTQETYTGRRRLFRDPDDRMIGGVCSGIAYHFGFDPIWLRIAFVLSVFLWGFGITLYIIMLILIPTAHTAAEKLEMRGRPVDINNIKQIIEEDMEDFKKRAKNFGNDMRNWRRSPDGRRFGRNVDDFFGSLGHGLGNVIGGVFKGIFAFIGFILILVFTTLLVALVVSLWTGMNVIHIHSGSGHELNYSVQNLFNMFAIHGTEKTLLVVGVFLFIGIPLIALIIRFGRAIMGLRQTPKGISILLFIAWFAGLVTLLTGSMYTVKHFSAHSTTSDEVKFVLPATVNALHISMPKDEDARVSVTIDTMNFYITDEADIFRGTPSLCIGTSPDTNYHLVITKYARGENDTAAKEAASNIEYTFAQHDSTLQLSPYYSIGEGMPWRKQKVDATLEIPLNKTIDMPDGIDHIICYAVHHKNHHLGGHRWTMSKDGLVEVKNN